MADVDGDKFSQGKKGRELKNKRNRIIIFIINLINWVRRNITYNTIYISFLFLLFGFSLFIFRSCVIDFNNFLNARIKQYFPNQYEAILSVMTGKRNLASFISMAFSAGSVIFKITQEQYLSELNPHKVSTYTNVKFLVGILVCLTITSLYAHLTYLYTLEVICVVSLLCYSIALAANTYLFHNTDRLAQLSANYLIRVGEIRVLFQICKIKNWLRFNWRAIRDEVCTWHRLYTDTSKGTFPITEKADHQALIIKKMVEIDKNVPDLVPFIIGFYVVNPYSKVESKVQEMYIRLLAKELVTHEEFEKTNYYKHILGGIMVSYIIYTVLTGSFKVLSNKNLSSKTRTEERKRLVKIVKDCFFNFNSMVCENDKENNVEIFKTILSECTYIWLSIIIIFSLVMQDVTEVNAEFKKLLRFVVHRYHLEKVEYKVTQSDYQKKWIIEEASDLWVKLMDSEWLMPVNQKEIMECATLLQKLVYKEYYYPTGYKEWVRKGTSDLWVKLMIAVWPESVYLKGKIEWASSEIDFEKLNNKLKEISEKHKAGVVC